MFLTIYLVATVRLTAITLLVAFFDAEASGVGAVGTASIELTAPQAGSLQPLPAPHPGSAPQPGSQASPQQLVQLTDFFLQPPNRPFRPPKRWCFLRPPHAGAAVQPESQQPFPASQAGSAPHPFPAPHPGSAAHPASQASAQPLPAPQVGSPQQLVQLLPPLPHIRSRISKPNDWVQTVTLRTSAPRNNIRFIEPHLLCLWITRDSTSRSRGSVTPRM